MTDLIAALPPGPFARLATLLGDIKPGKEPINLSIGDPSGQVPAFITEAMTRAAASFGNYPAINGTPDWRQAAAGWLTSRFALPEGAIDAERHVLPLNGTREGLFLSLFPLMPLSRNGGKPAVAMPNPFYQAYAAAALGAGAEPIYVAATEDKGFLPDYAALPEETLRRLVAVYICSPSNPEGAAANDSYWAKLFALADRYDFTVLADECYADIYFDQPPACALPARAGESFRRLLSFHSLSKRSGLPGLRSGILTGDPSLIARIRSFRNVAGPQVAGPILAASAAAWRDETHVAANRALYRQKMEAAEKILGNRMKKPDGGFFLWLKVGDGEAFTLRLWREQGVRVLPGAYMGRDVSDGRAGDGSVRSPAGRSDDPEKNQSNPGFSYVRVALVSNLSTIMTALERVRETLG